MNAPADPPAENPLEQGFRLGDLTIDPHAGEVTGPGGREKLDPKVMDVLVVLAENAGHVVLREDLLARLWPNLVVTDDALSRCLYELRRQLSHAGGDERYKAMLETVPKRGYRLNGPVMRLAAEAGRACTPRPKWPIAAAVAAIVVAVAAWFALAQREDQPATTAASTSYSVAVLPFVDLSPAQDQEHFSDGISDEILYRLNQSPTLKVIARPSSFSFKGQETSIPEIAAKLHVTHVLEGSVRKSGNRVRLTVRLAEAASNTQVWSETYDYELGDIFEIQEEIAGQVATALNATLASGPAHDPKEAALEPFLRAEFFYNRRAAGDIVRAVKYYQQALSIDPEYARAWASLSGAYALLAFGGDMNREEALAKQGEAARKAVALDPEPGRRLCAAWPVLLGHRRSRIRLPDPGPCHCTRSKRPARPDIPGRHRDAQWRCCRGHQPLRQDRRTRSAFGRPPCEPGNLPAGRGPLRRGEVRARDGQGIQPGPGPGNRPDDRAHPDRPGPTRRGERTHCRTARRRRRPRSRARAPVLRTGPPHRSGCGAQSPRCEVGAADRHPTGRDLRVSWHERPGVRDSPGPAKCG